METEEKLEALQKSLEEREGRLRELEQLVTSKEKLVASKEEQVKKVGSIRGNRRVASVICFFVADSPRLRLSRVTPF